MFFTLYVASRPVPTNTRSAICCVRQYFAGDLEDLIRHGLHALRETLQQDKELTINNTSIGIIGPAGNHEKVVPPEGPFRILEGEEIDVYLKTMIPKESGEAAPPAAPPAAPVGGAATEGGGTSPSASVNFRFCAVDVF